jgi:hypothetical protein
MPTGCTWPRLCFHILLHDAKKKLLNEEHFTYLDDTVLIRNRNSLITSVRHKINNFPYV